MKRYIHEMPDATGGTAINPGDQRSERKIDEATLLRELFGLTQIEIPQEATLEEVLDLLRENKFTEILGQTIETFGESNVFGQNRPIYNLRDERPDQHNGNRFSAQLGPTDPYHTRIWAAATRPTSEGFYETTLQLCVLPEEGYVLNPVDLYAYSTGKSSSGIFREQFGTERFQDKSNPALMISVAKTIAGEIFEIVGGPERYRQLVEATQESFRHLAQH